MGFDLAALVGGLADALCVPAAVGDGHVDAHCEIVDG